MAWDDSPPTAPDVQTSPPQGGWDAAAPTKDELESPSVGGFAKNLGHDVVDTAKGVASLGIGLATHPIDTSVGVLSGLPRAVVGEGKRLGIGEALTGHPINAVEKFGGALYDKPLTTALDVLPAAGAVGKALGIGGEAARVAEMAAEAGKAADLGETAAKVGGLGAEAGRAVSAAPEAVDMGPEVANILKTAPTSAAETATESVPLGSTFQDTVANLGKHISEDVKAPLSQVGDYLSQKYGQASANPNWANTIADYTKQHAQNMTLKELGAAPGQIRKIGVDRARALADYADQNGLVGKTGTIGREQIIPQRLNEAGGAVGAFRKMAADRGAVVNPDDFINQIRTQLDQKYLQPGLHSGEKGLYSKALAELKRSGGRADDVADKVSELFKESKNLDRLKQPSGPIADVARVARDINHDMISKALTPDEMKLYEHGLEDYGALTQINEFVKRRGSTEAGGRLGPGSGISRAAVQKFLDSVGYRAQAKIMRGLSDKIRSNPEIVKTPTNLFRNYADQAAEAIDEMTTDVGQ